MSLWTHIAGCIRYECFGSRRKDLIQEILGTTVSYDDPDDLWKKCNVPLGSEGSLRYYIYEEPNKSLVPSFNVLIWGDLRDFGEAKEDIDSVKKWFREITIEKLEKPEYEKFEIRDAVLLVRVEWQAPIILTYEGFYDNEKDSFRSEIIETQLK